MLSACGGLLGLGYGRSFIGEPRLNPLSNWIAPSDGPGFGGATSMDMSMYMEMFVWHNEIRRTVEEIPGVRTTTEFASPDLAALLHAAHTLRAAQARVLLTALIAAHSTVPRSNTHSPSAS